MTNNRKKCATCGKYIAKYHENCGTCVNREASPIERYKDTDGNLTASGKAFLKKEYCKEGIKTIKTLTKGIRFECNRSNILTFAGDL